MPGRQKYIEDFDDGPGGWLTWKDNLEGAARLEMQPGAAVARVPCWVDYLHAPPGAGYLHILFFLHTARYPPFPERWLELGGGNRFIGRFPTDFTGARVTLRLKGDIDLKGSQLLFHAQAKVGERYVNYALTGQPIEITREWSEQTITLDLDPEQGLYLGQRHDREALLGAGPIDAVLGDLNRDIHLILFPLDVVPAQPLTRDPHWLKAGEDYPVDESRLPHGSVLLDRVEIEW